MAIESVSPQGSPTVAVPARKLLDNYRAAIELSIKMEGAVGIMAVVMDRLDENTNENNALNAALAMLRECLEKSEALQWPIGYDCRALEALSFEGAEA